MSKRSNNLQPPPRPEPSRSDSKAIVTAILDATKQLPLDASMNAIAERAGVGIASVYRYFPSKDAIYAELGRRLHTQLLQITIALLEEATTLEEAAEKCAILGIDRSFGQQQVVRHVHLELPFTWHNDDAAQITSQLVDIAAQHLATYVVGTPEQLRTRAAMMVIILKGASRVSLMFPAIAPSPEEQLGPLTAALLACATDGLERRPPLTA